MIFEIVESDKKQHRLFLCKNCTKFNCKLHICSVCNCFISVKIKFKHTSCPIGNW